MEKTSKNGNLRRRVHFIEERYSEDLEGKTNDFLSNIDTNRIVDIKFTEVAEGFTVMVIYDEFVPDDGGI